LKIEDLASNGARLTMFTEESIKDLENKLKWFINLKQQKKV
jgi:hypothetical protein